MSKVTPVPFPTQSALYAGLSRASFHDAFSAPLDDGSLTPTEILLRAIRATPPWVSRLMTIRNRVVRKLGLKDVGAMKNDGAKPARSYAVGDRIGIFTILSTDDGELLLGIDDSHLDVRVSVSKPEGERSRRYVLATVVDVHNCLGRAYMIPVGRLHPFVVKAMMRQALP